MCDWSPSGLSTVCTLFVSLTRTCEMCHFSYTESSIHPSIHPSRCLYLFFAPCCDTLWSTEPNDLMNILCLVFQWINAASYKFTMYSLVRFSPAQINAWSYLYNKKKSQTAKTKTESHLLTTTQQNIQLMLKIKENPSLLGRWIAFASTVDVFKLWNVMQLDKTRSHVPLSFI